MQNISCNCKTASAKQQLQSKSFKMAIAKQQLQNSSCKAQLQIAMANQQLKKNKCSRNCLKHLADPPGQRKNKILRKAH